MECMNCNSRYMISCYTSHFLCGDCGEIINFYDFFLQNKNGYYKFDCYYSDGIVEISKLGFGHEIYDLMSNGADIFDVTSVASD